MRRETLSLFFLEAWIRGLGLCRGLGCGGFTWGGYTESAQNYWPGRQRQLHLLCRFTAVAWGMGVGAGPVGGGREVEAAGCKPASPRGDTWVQILALPQGVILCFARGLVVGGRPYRGGLIGL